MDIRVSDYQDYQQAKKALQKLAKTAKSKVKKLERAEAVVNGQLAELAKDVKRNIDKEEKAYLTEDGYCSICDTLASWEPEAYYEGGYFYCDKCNKTLYPKKVCQDCGKEIDYWQGWLCEDCFEDRQTARCPKCGEPVRDDTDGLCAQCV